MTELKAYSGLIRNHKELASQLNVNVEGCSRIQREEKLMVSAYDAWGDQMGNHINGQFAVVLYDNNTNELFCTRDKLGAELLYYYQTEDGQLLAGTQISDLMHQPGFKRQLNRKMVQFFLSFNYVPGEETLFAGVYKLQPGGFLRFGKQGLQLGKYWELSFQPDESKSLEDWADEIEQAMEASLRDVCDEDDVPDSFLSGGVDSSYILAKSRAKCGYCAAYAEQQVSEEEDARAAAEYLGRDFKGLTVSREQFFATVDEFLRAYEQPTGDPAGLSLYCACKQMVGTSQLCFSGEGADEFFAGYSVYGGRYAKQMKLPGAVYQGTTCIMDKPELTRFLKNYYDQYPTRQFMKERGAKGRAYDTVSWMLYTDLRTYFESSILFNSTRIARGTGLDVRMPYCDLRMFDIACRMPTRFKVTKEGNKLALRAAASRVLPQEVAYRRKLGFPVPVRSWLADPEANADIQRAFASEAAAKFFNLDEIGALLDVLMGRKPRVSHPIWFARRKNGMWRYVWVIYVFIRWYELFFGEDAEESAAAH